MKSIIIFSLVILFITSGYVLNGCKRHYTRVDFSESNDTLIVFNGQKYRLYRSTEHQLNYDWEKAPDIISKKAEKFVIDNFGDKYYSEHCKMIGSYIHPNPVKIHDYRVFYSTFFNYKITISDYYKNFLLKISLDSLGRVVESYKITNIKDDSSLGMPYKIKHFEAVNIAIENNFNTGLSPWIVGVIYDRRDLKYYWRISNQTAKYGGSVLFIDPITGKIVKRATWVT